MVSSADLEEESIKTFAMRPALEWALLKLHDDDTSLDSIFVLLYRLYTGEDAQHCKKRGKVVNSGSSCVPFGVC
ncbi:unnamed protein product [Symbiodinium sp. CCMP2592]|nr:unnamed protein product [Symbiodinium sp. CCMP2592]